MGQSWAVNELLIFFNSNHKSVLAISINEMNKKSKVKSINTVRDLCNLPNCKKEATQKCGRCRSVFYCDKYCQKRDWPEHRSNCKVIKSSPNDRHNEKSSSVSKVNLHAECWKFVRNPVTNDIIKIVDPLGKTYNVKGAEIKDRPSTSTFHNSDGPHNNCLRAIRDPETNNIVGAVDSSAYFYKVEEDGKKDMEKRVQKVSIDVSKEPKDLQVEIKQWGKLFWDLDWEKMTHDAKELVYIYICCTKARKDSTNLESEISTGVSSLLKWMASGGGLIDAGVRRVHYMNRSMREAGPNYQEIAHGGEAADISVCRVILGKDDDQRPIEVKECVVASSAFTMRPGDKERQNTWSSKSHCLGYGPKTLIEITVESRIKFGDRVTVELNLDFVRDIFEKGDNHFQIQQLRYKYKPLYGIVNMNQDNMKLSLRPSNHHLKDFENHESDLNCRIIGLAMNVEGSYNPDVIE